MKDEEKKKKKKKKRTVKDGEGKTLIVEPAGGWVANKR